MLLEKRKTDRAIIETEACSAFPAKLRVGKRRGEIGGACNSKLATERFDRTKRRKIVMARIFFVTIVAPSRRTLAKLQEYDFDLFQSTSKLNERKEFTIEGLLTLEEVGRLVEDGYRVVVEEESSKRSRAQSETIQFEDWIKGMEE